MAGEPEVKKDASGVLASLLANNSAISVLKREILGPHKLDIWADLTIGAYASSHGMRFDKIIDNLGGGQEPARLLYPDGSTIVPDTAVDLKPGRGSKRLTLGLEEAIKAGAAYAMAEALQAQLISQQTQNFDALRIIIQIGLNDLDDTRRQGNSTAMTQLADDPQLRKDVLMFVSKLVSEGLESLLKSRVTVNTRAQAYNKVRSTDPFAYATMPRPTI